MYTGPLKPANRQILAACLSLAGLASLAIATLVLVNALGSPALAVTFENGYYPPDSGSAVHSARTGVLAATVLIVLSTVLSGIAVIFRSAIVRRLIGGIALLALIVVLPLLWFVYSLVF